MMKKKNSFPPKTSSKFKRVIRFIRKSVFYLILALILLFTIPRLITEFFARKKIHSTVETVPTTKIAIVFGAGLTRNGTVTRVLKDRVDAAAELYHNEKVGHILMSGDNSYIDYNEPAAMYDYAVSLGIPEEDITLDYAGRRTYDTCYRAKEIFGVSEAILVTQRFHLPRAIYLCNMLGVTAEGYNANMTYYLKRSRIIWNLREMPATLVALTDLWFTHPVPVLGKPEPIYID